MSAGLLLLTVCIVMYSSPTAASYVESVGPWCGESGDSGYSCVVKEGQLLVLPCGHLSPQPGFTYYHQSTGQVLLSNSSSYLHWYPRWNDSGSMICCHTPHNPHTNPCYHINVLYSPVFVPTSWPVGINKSPILGHPYELSCPLMSNPPANYTWTRYNSPERTEILNFPNDVIFSEEGRKWRIGGYSMDHDGVYECHATNQIGEKHYSNDGLFFLKTAGCFGRSNTRVNIATPTAMPTTDGSIILTCTVDTPLTYGMKPYWFIISDNGSQEVVSGWPRPLYDEDMCRWWAELRVRSVKSGAHYVCQYGTHKASVKLEVPLAGVSIKLVSMVTGATLVVGLILLIGQRSQTIPTAEPPSNGFTYDVFVCAHDEMRRYIETNIIHPLESRDHTHYHTPYRVCWHLRDFIAGLPITEQIAEAVKNSRKVLFIFSEHFSESKFCQFELELAMKRLVDTNVRCVVPMATSEGVVPAKVKRLLTYCSVESVSDSKEWRKLLGDPINADSAKIKL